MNKILFLLIVTFTFGLSPKSINICIGQDESRVLVEGEFAPDFIVRDALGASHSIEKYKGKKILISFFRNAGCPVSYYRFMELEQARSYFELKGIILISIFESSPNNVKLLASNQSLCQALVADPEGILYQKYGIDANKSKITLGYLHGAKQKAQKGKKGFPVKIKQDGNPDRLSADFLIDEQGNILIAHYSKYLGDHLPLEMIKLKIP